MNLFDSGHNDFLSSGFVLMFGGFLMSRLSQIGYGIVSLIKRFGFYSFQIENDTPEFEWVAAWLSSLEYSKKVKSVVLQNIKKISQGSYYDSDNQDQSIASLSVLPDYGIHIVKYNNVWMLVNIVKDKKPTVGSDGALSTETITCLYWTPNGREFLYSILETGRDIVVNKLKDKVTIFISSSFDWRNAGARKFRSIDSIILPEEDKKRVVDDLEVFLKSEDRYFNLGMPWKRGYLFYGMPGTGKSSFIQSLATYFKKDIYILALSNKGLGDIELYNRLSEVKQNSFLLIEDIDCLTDVSRDQDKGTGVSLSGLLNALDGIPAQNGQIVFMTTNCIEKLDSALVRAGRIDLKLHFDYATEEQIMQACKRFFPTNYKTVFSIVNTSENQTMAQVQEKLITLLN